MLGTMPSQRQLAALRGEVAALEARAARKMNRLARVNNAHIQGSKLDPRRNGNNVARYTARQLEAYKANLTTFNSRGTQYYADAQGQIVSNDVVKRYKSAERRYNISKEKFYQQFARLKNAGGTTIQDRMAMVTPLHGSMVQEVNAPYKDIKRHPKQFRDQASMAKMAGVIEERIARGWTEEIRRAREQFVLMAEAVDAPSIMKDAMSLSDKQFAALWFYTGFARHMSEQYAVYQMMLADKRGSWLEDIREQSSYAAHQEIKNARRWRIK